jgi:hypothetical protein
MKTEINDFIGVFDDTGTEEYCDFLVDFFDRMQNIGKVDSRVKFENVSPTIKDNSLYMFMKETDPLIINQQATQLHPFLEVIQKCYKSYVEEYGTIEDVGRHALNPDIKLQKTLPGEGYHVWHSEVMGILSSRRFLLCMLYLNDVDEGGETEFLYQHKRIASVKGRVVICPTAFTHTHRGNPPLNRAKYMINGWMEFISTER